MVKLISSRDCKALCGGKIEWLDYGAAEGEERYEIRHVPGGGSVRTRFRSKAKSIRDQLVEGVDDYGVLPQANASKPETHKPKKEKARKAKSPRARTQVTSTSEESPPKTLEEQSLELSSALEKAFPWTDIVAHINAMLSAIDIRYAKDGHLVETPNWHARKSAIELLLQYKAGKTFARPEPKVNKKLDGNAFKERLKKSPAFLKSIEAILNQVKEEAEDGTRG